MHFFSPWFTNGKNRALESEKRLTLKKKFLVEDETGDSDLDFMTRKWNPENKIIENQDFLLLSFDKKDKYAFLEPGIIHSAFDLMNWRRRNESRGVCFQFRY